MSDQRYLTLGKKITWSSIVAILASVLLFGCASIERLASEGPATAGMQVFLVALSVITLVALVCLLGGNILVWIGMFKGASELSKILSSSQEVMSELKTTVKESTRQAIAASDKMDKLFTNMAEWRVRPCPLEKATLEDSDFIRLKKPDAS